MIRRYLRRSDDGYTMVFVLFAFFVVSSLALVALVAATRSVGTSRTSQEFRAALGAAQAGVQDYITRLNECDTYWQNPTACTTVSANPALGGWSTVPGTSGANAATYQQAVLSDPMSTITPGVIRLKVTGKVGGVERTIVTDLKKAGFLKFLYFTDFETFSPASTAALSYFQDTSMVAGNGRTIGQTKSASLANGAVVSASPLYLSTSYTYRALRPTEDQVRAGCQLHYYRGRTTFPRTIARYNKSTGALIDSTVVWPSDSEGSNLLWNAYSGSDRAINFSCLAINFGGNDTINGPLHTNDALRFSGNPTFNDPLTESSWPSTGVAVTPADPTKLWYGSGTPTNYSPVFKESLNMPPTNNNVKKMADGAQGGQGCLYTGPTTITFVNNGKIRVKSPYTKSTNAGCLGADPTIETEVTGPANGVIYVQDVPAATTDPNYRAACGAAAPLGTLTSGTGDSYDCSQGDVFVKGSVKGKFTVGSSHDVIVTGNTTYSGGLTGTDVLGLVGQNNVEVYHPANDSTRLTNIQIDAAIASVQNSFTVQNYSTGSNMGNLKVNGVIVQRFRGPVGIIGGAGYNKVYNYDNRLMVTPPPAFLEVEQDAWSSTGFSEQDG